MTDNVTKEKFLELLRSTNRDGIEELIAYLEKETDFFTAPASTKFHNNFAGGLLEHSLNVYENFTDLLGMKGIEMKEESVILCSLLHDVCKSNSYVLNERNRKNKETGKWESYTVWETDRDIREDLLPHASRSLRILRRFIKLSNLEELVIFYHMGPYGGGRDDFEYSNMLKRVNTLYPQTLLFYAADLISAYMDEKTVE